MTAEETTKYQVLARKYRPETFSDLIGQEAMVRTLKNAFDADIIVVGFQSRITSISVKKFPSKPGKRLIPNNPGPIATSKTLKGSIRIFFTHYIDDWTSSTQTHSL